MKKTVLLYGFLSGLIITASMLYTVSRINNGEDFKGTEIFGYI